jgi:hypothetical protein
MRKTIFASFLLLCFIQAYAKDPPEALYKAKTAVVINAGAEGKDFDKFREYLQKWGRFEFVQERSKADIIITLSSKEGKLNQETPGLGGGIMTTIPVRINDYRIIDAKDESLLWSDQTPPASKDTEILVSRLQKKLKKK